MATAHEIRELVAQTSPRTGRSQRGGAEFADCLGISEMSGAPCHIEVMLSRNAGSGEKRGGYPHYGSRSQELCAPDGRVPPRR